MEPPAFVVIFCDGAQTIAEHVGDGRFVCAFCRKRVKVCW